MYNPYNDGWINYYGQFYRTHLRPTLKRIDVYVIRQIKARNSAGIGGRPPVERDFHRQ
jgi:hypothetical protein